MNRRSNYLIRRYSECRNKVNKQNSKRRNRKALMPQTLLGIQTILQSLTFKVLQFFSRK
jgi:hypothetical protein